MPNTSDTTDPENSSVSDSDEITQALVKLVVDKGLASRDEIEAIRKRLKAEGETRDGQSIIDAMIQEGLLTQRQAEKLRPEALSSTRTGGGQQIAGFQVVSKLGSGAMATVYKAKQISLDRLVAIKILPHKFSNDAAFIKRFYDEGRAAAKLNHPNIVQAYDVGQYGDYHYFVMEYVDGWTAHDDIQSDGKYKEKRALEVAIDVAKALAHAHEKGFIHRDVKPKNIMITKNGVAKLADMGLARAVSDREAAEAEKGKAFGTPYYIAPEQVRGEVDIDAGADIYSLGATLFHLATGRVPFEGPNPTTVMYRHIKDDLEPPEKVNPKLSRGICEIIETCMAKEPSDRYANSNDLLSDLQSVYRGEAPMIARQNFDVSSLSRIEDGGVVDGPGQGLITVNTHKQAGLCSSPMFWAAILGWAMSLILLVTIVIMHLS